MAPGKFNAPVAVPSISCLFCPLRKERGPFVLPRKKRTGADSIVTIANGHGAGVWPGGYRQEKPFSGHWGRCQSRAWPPEAERLCTPCRRIPWSRTWRRLLSRLRREDGAESRTRPGAAVRNTDNCSLEKTEVGSIQD